MNDKKRTGLKQEVSEIDTVLVKSKEDFRRSIVLYVKNRLKIKQKKQQNNSN